MADLGTAPHSRSRAPDGARDPGRFTRVDAPARRSPLAAVGAALALLALLVGVPVLLVWAYGGVPLPDGWPDREVLTQPIGTQQLLTLLICVLWLAWLQFVVCVVVEAVSAVRGRGIPSAVPLAAPTQRLARVLVASLLVSGVAVGSASAAPGNPSTAPADGGVGPAAAAAAPAVPAPTQPAQAPVEVGPGPDGTYTSGHQVYAPGDPGGVASNRIAVEVTEDLVGKKVYVVQPHVGRHYDSLWDIAERHLGDGRRYQEIYDLNVHRPQPNGGQLHLARLIQPGWQLVMPDDAVGVDRVQPPPPPAPAPPTPAAPAPAPPGDGAPLAGPGARVADAVPYQDADEAGGSGLSGRAGLGAGVTGGLLLAGLVSALVRRRGPYGEPDELEERLRWSADPERAATLAASLRQLAAACRAGDRELPEVALAELDGQEVRLAVAGLPPAATPPAPWRRPRDGAFALAADVDAVAAAVPAAANAGRTDRAGRGSRAADPVGGSAGTTGPAPYPALVNVGRRDGVEVLVDLEVAPGLVSLGGDGAVAGEVLTSWAAELATSAWADGAAVTLVGLPTDAAERLVALAPGRVRAVERLSHVLDEVEEAGARWRSLQEALRVDGVLAGRLAAPERAARPQVLLLAEPPAEAEAGRLERLVRGTRTPFAVVCVGQSPAARWRFEADADGRLALGVLGPPVDAHRLTASDLGLVAEALGRASTGAAAGAALVRSGAPTAVLAHVGGGASDARVEPVEQAEGRAAVEVRLLGTVRVDVVVPAGPEPDAETRSRLTELVALVALHPAGLHDAVLRSSLWPRGVSDEVVRATTEHAAHWLGTAPDGRPRLRRGGDGQWRLAPDVRSDWRVFQGLVRRADRGSDGDAAGAAHELDDLQAALALVRGPAFAPPRPGAYGWLAFHRAARDARALGTTVAHRAASLAVEAGDRQRAEALLRAGLTLVPTAELLWRDLLWLLGSDDPAAAAQVSAELYRTLGLHSVQLPEAETDALVERLAPGTRRDRPAG